MCSKKTFIIWKRISRCHRNCLQINYTIREKSTKKEKGNIWVSTPSSYPTIAHPPFHEESNKQKRIGFKLRNKFIFYICLPCLSLLGFLVSTVPFGIWVIEYQFTIAKKYEIIFSIIRQWDGGHGNNLRSKKICLACA